MIAEKHPIHERYGSCDSFGPAGMCSACMDYIKLLRVAVVDDSDQFTKRDVPTEEHVRVMSPLVAAINRLPETRCCYSDIGTEEKRGYVIIEHAGVSMTLLFWQKDILKVTNFVRDALQFRRSWFAAMNTIRELRLSRDQKINELREQLRAVVVQRDEFARLARSR